MPLPNSRIGLSVYGTVLPCFADIAAVVDAGIYQDIDHVGDAHIEPFESNSIGVITYNEERVPTVGPRGVTPMESWGGELLEISYIAAALESVPPLTWMNYGELADRTAVANWWAGQLQDILVAACQLWTADAVVDIVSVDSSLQLDGAFKIYRAKLRITAGDDVATCQRRFVVGRYAAPGGDTPDLELNSVQLGSSVPPRAGTSQGGVYINTSSIVEALRDISTMRAEFSINNGAAMFSINGGTRTED